MRIVLSILLLCSLATPTAWAGKKTANQAEVRRLYEDADRLSKRGAWGGVERAYLQMVTLERKGAEVAHDVHLLGAHAAQNRGDPFATWERLKAAQKAESRMETLTWIATIEATYSRFEVTIHPSYEGEITLTSLDPLFDPVHLSTLAAAEGTLRDNRYLDGLLPLGRYRLAETVALDSYGGETQVVVLRANRATVSDPSDLQIELPDLTKTARHLDVVVREDLDATAWGKLASLLQTKMLGLQGVDAIEVINVPERRYFADYDPAVLSSLELDGAHVAQAIRSAYLLTDQQIEVGPRQIVVGTDAVKSLEELGRTEVPIQDALVTLNTLTRLREGPEPGAPAAGLLIKLTTAADVGQVHQGVTAVLEGEKSFTEAGVVLTTPAPATEQ